jgi:osmotically-inducible protein OsmY
MSRARVAHRSDAEIFADARFALDNQPAVPGTVHVHVVDGIATLTGTVRRPTDRTTAEQVVRRVDGVRDVIDLVMVWQMDGAEAIEGADQ